MASMLVLAVDTSSHVGTVALLQEGVLLAEWSARVRASHGETLLPYVAQVLEAAGVTLSAVDLFAVGLGPGSFTGVRIGLATAKGLALAENKPLVGITSLAVLARAAITGEGAVIAAVDAYKNEVYAAAYRLSDDGALHALLPPFHASPAVAAAQLRSATSGLPTALVGNALARYGAEFSAGLAPSVRSLPAFFDVPRAACLAHEAEQQFLRAGASDLATLEPLYVRDSDAKLPVSASVS